MEEIWNGVRDSKDMKPLKHSCNYRLVLNRRFVCFNELYTLLFWPYLRRERSEIAHNVVLFQTGNTARNNANKINVICGVMLFTHNLKKFRICNGYSRWKLQWLHIHSKNLIETIVGEFENALNVFKKRKTTIYTS